MSVRDFKDALKNVRTKDLVFIDPPYTIAHNNNGFVKYNQKIFSYEDQVRLKEFIVSIKKLGAYYIMTNASHQSMTELFDIADRMLFTSRRNAVGGRTAERGSAIESLFTNVPSTSDSATTDSFESFIDSKSIPTEVRKPLSPVDVESISPNFLMTTFRTDGLLQPHLSG